MLLFSAQRWKEDTRACRGLYSSHAPVRQLRCFESASRRRRRRRRCIHNASAMSDASAPNDREALQQMRTTYSVAMTPVHFLPTARAAQLRVCSCNLYRSTNLVTTQALGEPVKHRHTADNTHIIMFADARPCRAVGRLCFCVSLCVRTTTFQRTTFDVDI